MFKLKGSSTQCYTKLHCDKCVILLFVVKAIYSSLSNMTFIDLSPAVCKFKAHKRCAVRSTNNCKWTTLASIGNDVIEDEEGVSDQG